MIILKSESKPDEREREKKEKKNDDDKNMVQIHDEQRSIQIKLSRRDTDKSTA